MRRFIEMRTKGALYDTSFGYSKGKDRWVAQPFDSWWEFPLACWRLWKTREHWL